MATTPYEIDDLLKKIDKPTTLYAGDNDEQFIPEKIFEYHKLIHAPVTTELIKNAGHLSILLKAPELIYRAIKQQNQME